MLALCMMSLKGWDFRLLFNPLGGVQCSFEHKLPRRRGSRGQRESTEPEIGVAGREQARPRFPAFLAGSGRSSPNQRSSRQGMLARRKARAMRPHRPSCFWLQAGSSYAALRITYVCMYIKTAVAPDIHTARGSKEAHATSDGAGHATPTHERLVCAKHR